MKKVTVGCLSASRSSPVFFLRDADAERRVTVQVKVISGHQVKKVKQKIRDLELRCMFLGQIFAKNAKNDPKTLLKQVDFTKHLHAIGVMSVGFQFIYNLCRGWK